MLKKVKQFYETLRFSKKENDYYINQYKTLHKQNDYFGTSTIEKLNHVILIINYIKPNTVLDYGCGKGTLIKELKKIYPNILFDGYDPAVKEYDQLPLKKYDLIICTDVLEHIPEKNINSILFTIKQYSSNVFFQLHHAKASQILPNGENAHCTIKPPKWYQKLLSNVFDDVIILPAQQPWLSSCFTFKINDSFLSQYNNLIKNSK